MKHGAKRKGVLAMLFLCLCFVLSCAFITHGSIKQEATAATTDLLFMMNSEKTGYRVMAMIYAREFQCRLIGTCKR